MQKSFLMATLMPKGITTKTLARRLEAARKATGAEV
jgi:hypothetical protein